MRPEVADRLNLNPAVLYYITRGYFSCILGCNISSKVTSPQDAQRCRFTPWLEQCLLGRKKNEVDYYLATRPEVEGFRDQDLFT